MNEKIHAIKSLKFKSAFLENICLSHIIPSLLHCLDFILNSSTKSLGFAYVQASLAQLDMCLMQLPLDPFDYSLAKVDILEKKEEIITANVIVELEMNVWKYGRSQDLKRLLNERLQLRNKIESKSQKKVLRPSQSEIDDILQDFRNLRQLVLSNQDIYMLIFKEEDAITHVKYMDQSLTSVINRLNDRYQLYRDIILPVSEAVYSLKCGLFLMIKDDLMISQSSEKLLTYLHKFIGLGEYEPFCQLLSEVSYSSKFSKENQLERHIFSLVMTTLYHSGSFTYGSHAMNTILGYLSSIAVAWKADNERNSDQQRQKEDLYKYKAEAYEYDAPESDDQNVAVYFPDFYSAFEEDSSQTEYIDDCVFGDSMIQHILNAHELAFSDRTKAFREVFEENWARNFRKGYKIGAVILSSSEKHYPVEVDYFSQTGSRFITSYYSKNAFSETLYDFYSMPDVEEANMVIASVTRFASRISMLLLEWPEHNVLQCLKVLCDKIFNLPIKTPIMKLLNGIEMLLQKSQDWESYAHKNNSISIELADISSSIVRLRKKELSSWKDLFALERRKCAINAGKLWINLWDMIIIPLLNPMTKVISFT